MTAVGYTALLVLYGCWVLDGPWWLVAAAGTIGALAAAGACRQLE
jgi:hypothetical protein